MRAFLKCGLLVISTASLMIAPVKAMPGGLASAPIGLVTENSRGLLNGNKAPEGATIYDGDILEAQSEMPLQAHVSRSEIQLQSSSSVQIRSLSKGFSADLLHGIIVISSAEGETFQLHADGATISPVGIGPTVVQVTWISANALLLGSRRGRVEVSMDREASTLEPGIFYRLEIWPGDSGSQDNPKPGTEHGGIPRPTGRNRVIWIVIPAIAAVTGVVIWRALVSPTAP